MGRPLKQDADWFKHDKHMRNDEKIRAVRRKFGHEGYSIWCMTLEKLTDSDGFSVSGNPLDIEFQAADFDIDVPKLKEIWDYFVQIGILQREQIDGNDCPLLSSRHLKERFEALIANRNRDREDFSQRKHTDKIRGEEKRLREGRPAGGAPPPGSEPQEKEAVYKSRQSHPPHDEAAALLRQARESKAAGIPLMGIELQALREVGEAPPESSGAVAAGDFPEAAP